MRILVISALFLIALLLPARAQQTNLFNYAANNGTNATIAITLSNIYVPGQAIAVQFGPITNVYGGNYTTNGVTNAIAAYLQFSVDGGNSNWITIASMYPRYTNGDYRVFTLPNVTTNISQRVLLVSTNSLPIGVWHQ